MKGKKREKLNAVTAAVCCFFIFVVLLTFSVLCTCLIFPFGVVAALGFMATCLPPECFRVVFPKNENSAGMLRVIIMIAFENFSNFRSHFFGL